MDQDYGLMQRMVALTNVYSAVSAWFNLKGDAIHRMSEQTRKILRFLLDNNINFNA